MITRANVMSPPEVKGLGVPSAAVSWVAILRLPAALRLTSAGAGVSNFRAMTNDDPSSKSTTWARVVVDGLGCG